MELVRAFNSELSSIYESKPPVSKAKMASITRYAVKALKYYKHIVYSVEKFLQKCRNEYKIAGLYVLDSIIRQSRHQFGAEKDLFGPRFQKNIKLLFQHIYQCPHEDKPKIVRVLNLWQKNGIYSPEVISPLVDMASVSSKVLATSIQRHKKAQKASREKMLDDNDFVNAFEPSTSFDEGHSFGSSSSKRKKIQMSQDDEIQVLKAQLEQQRKQQELLQQQLQMQIMSTKQQSLQMQLQQQQIQNKLQEQLHQSLVDSSQGLIKPDGNTRQENLVASIQDISQQLERDKQSLSQQSGEKDVTSSNAADNVIENQAQFLENFQQLIQTAKGMVQKDPRQSNSSEAFEASSKQAQQEQPHPFQYDESGNTQDPRIADHRPRVEHESKWLARQGDGFLQKHENLSKPDDHLATHQNPLADYYSVPPQGKRDSEAMEDDDAMQIDNDDEYNVQEYYSQQVPFTENLRRSRWGPAQDGGNLQQEGELNRHQVDEKKPMPKKKKIEDEETKRREKAFMPPSLKKQMTVASITVWVGRLPKGIHPDVISMAFSEYGEVTSIDLIDARGCCFVTMSCRSEADRALRHLKYKRIDGCEVKMAWGQPKGLQDFSKFWDESFGAAFIPWEFVKPHHLEELLDGCLIDDSTIPPGVVKPTVSAEQPSENTDPPPTIPAPPIFMNNLPPAMLPPPPPPGLLPPGFRPPLLPGVLPIGMRPPPGAPQLPTLLPTLQQILSNQSGPRPPLLQVPEQTRNLDPRVTPGPINSQPGQTHFQMNRPPFKGNRPPFSMRGNEVVFNRPRIPAVTESGVNYLPMDIRPRPPLIGVDNQIRGLNESVFPPNPHRGRLSDTNFAGESEDNQSHNENVSLVAPQLNNKKDGAPEDRSRFSEQGGRIQERYREEGRDRQYRNDNRGREAEKERRDGRERRNDREYRRDDRFDRRERRDEGRFERRDERSDRSRRDRFGDRGGGRYDGGRGARDRSRNRYGCDEFGRDEDRYKRSDREETRISPKYDAESRDDEEQNSKSSFKSAFADNNTTSEANEDAPVSITPVDMTPQEENNPEIESETILTERKIEESIAEDQPKVDVKSGEIENEVLEETHNEGDELYDPLAEEMSPVNAQPAVVETTSPAGEDSKLVGMESKNESRNSPIFPISNEDDAIFPERDIPVDDVSGDKNPDKTS